MSYFKIGENDYSIYTSALKVATNTTYRAQTNAAGDTVVDNQKAKRNIEVGIIPIDAAAMAALQNDIASFKVNLSFMNPLTNTLEENIVCIIPSNEVEYYTIRSGNVSFKAFNLKFIEL